jgi:DNA-binding transcriptional ArsR family regulator
VAAVVNASTDGLERIGTALADRVRRNMLVRLLDGPAYPSEFAGLLGESRSNVSNHLACLRGCGLVRVTREGRKLRYELADQQLADALRLLAELDLRSCPAHLDRQ